MDRLARGRVVAVAGLVFIVFAGAFFASSLPFAIPEVEAACGAPPLDVRFYASEAEVNDFLAGCGDSGRGAYRNMQIADLFYPLVFGGFMASALALALKHLFPGRPWMVGLAAVAFIGSGFDYLENAMAWLALAAFPNQTVASALLGPVSTAKNGTFWFAGSVLLAAMAALAVRSVASRFD